MPGGAPRARFALTSGQVRARLRRMPAPVPQSSGGRRPARREALGGSPKAGTWPRKRSDSRSPGPAPRPAPARRAPAVPSPPAAALLASGRRSCRYGAGTGAAPSWDPPQFKGPVGHAVLPLRMPHDGAADARQPGSAGCGKCSGSTGSWRSSSSSSIIRRPSRVPGCQSSGTSVAAAISSRSSGEIDSTQHCVGRCAAAPARRTPCACAARRSCGCHAPPRPAPTRRAWAAPPDARLGLHHHHARDRVEQLRAAMTMAAHAMAVLVVHRQSGHGRAEAS